MKRRFDILVVGAGITGLTAATLLARNGGDKDLQVTVVDAGQRPQDVAGGELGLRVSAISAGSAQLLDSIGAWERLDNTRLCAYDHMRVWDESDEPGGAATLNFDAGEFAVPHLGYIVENEQLKIALLRTLSETDVEMRFDSRLQEIASRGNAHRVSFDNGVTLDADLIVAADGANSHVRNIFDIDVSTHLYQQHALVTHLRPEMPHRETAWQRFLRDGPIGLLPLADGRVSIVWSTTPDDAEHAKNCSDEELGQLLTDVSGRVLGELVVAGPRGVFPLAARHAERYVDKGVALLGDAAHTVHPLAGQGANLGIADADEISRVVREAVDKHEYPGDRPVLRRYERARKGENAAMMHFMTGLNRLFASDSVVLEELRKAGMALFNRSGLIRRRVVGVALGRNQR
ncbi:MAG: UbiH/UbiF/VisC/COQ6 family ubiquinone biosynthesis hydroxylase [Woeseiaceae bacterium]|nr:UbiH/UbiF/VisC/COQ6 family ubiquinone biosynthesis hydroxylase [Woeseiaceae bacterium]